MIVLQTFVYCFHIQTWTRKGTMRQLTILPIFGQLFFVQIKCVTYFSLINKENIKLKYNISPIRGIAL